MLKRVIPLLLMLAVVPVAFAGDDEKKEKAPEKPKAVEAVEVGKKLPALT